MGWRGLWMTKNIEGTVDDDIAAKLAIGEGRQVHILDNNYGNSSGQPGDG